MCIRDRDKINTDFDIYSVFAGERAIVRGRAIERGTDFLTAYLDVYKRQEEEWPV